MKKITAILFASFLAPAAIADTPRVVTDIAPIHGLVSKVMGDLGQPSLLVEQTATPHSYALRPSQAGSLEQADIVFVASDVLTPWLHGPLESLARAATVVELMLVENTIHYDFREGEDDHDHDHDHEGENGEELLDPHGWLDPANAIVWVRHIAAVLSDADAENAAIYQANAENYAGEIELLTEELSVQLNAYKTQPYMVLHDAFQYFDRRFELAYAGSIALGDASAPSPARIAHAREELEEHNVQCVFKEPQQNDRLVQVVVEGAGAKVGELDPLGASLTPGPDLYVQLMQGLADSFDNCFAD